MGAPAACSRGLFQAEPALEIMDVQAALTEGRMPEDFLVERDVGLDPFNHHFGESIAHPAYRFVAVLAMGNGLPH